MTSPPRTHEPPPLQTRPRLTWQDAAGEHAVDLDEAQTTGSAARCELVIADKAVSRLHCELDPAPDGLWVRDLGSHNGTYVNGVRVIEARVPAASLVRIGTTDITVTYGPLAPPSEAPPTPTRFGELEGRSAPMRALFAAVSKLAATDRPLVLEGEPGTGKKALARAIHDASPRAGAPFVIVECAGLPEPPHVADVLEDALGGAEGGTLVLDAPSELSLAVQRELTPPVDAQAFRVIVTTQRDLRRLVNQGAFREGLYFRVAGATLRVPPLRERTGDLPMLLERFLGDHASLATPDLVSDLGRLPWMGNVRELELYAERLRSDDGVHAVLTARLDAFDFEDSLRMRGLEFPELGTAEGPALVGERPSEPPVAHLGRMLPVALEPWFLIGFKAFRERWIDLGEREYLRRLMLRTNRSSGAASREAGLERTYLYRLLKKHGV